MKRKPYIRYTLLGILLFLALCCVIRIMMPNKEWVYSGTYVFTEGEACTDRVIFEHIPLGIGVYRVELSYETAGDANAICNVKDGTVYSGGLLCNGEHLYRALGHTSYDFWLYEPTQELTVTIDYSGQEKLTTGDLKIIETNLLWTRYLVILMALMLLTGGTVWFGKQDAVREGGEAGRRVIFGIGVIAFLASIPYLYDGLVSGADLTYHLQRIEGVKDGLLTGQFPVRLEPRWVFDHGYANGIFYCNMLLYFPALLRMAGFTVTESYILYCIALNIATASIAWYCFGKMFRDDVIGLLCSALYTLSIFRVFRLLSTGAVGEGSAFTFLPLVIYGIYLVFEANTQDRDFRNSWIILGLGYAGLIQTHVLSCEITAMAAILFCLCYLPRLFEKERFLKCVQGAFFSLGLSIWYLVPFLDYYMTQDVKIRHASARTIQNRGVTFFQELHTFWSIQDMAAEGREQYVYPTGPGMFLIFGVVVFFILLFIGVLRKENGSEKRMALRSAVLGCGFLWMATDRFPWDRLQAASGIASSLISSLQFPYRFIGWATILCVTVVGYLFLFFKKNTKTYYCVSLMIAAISIAVPLPYLYLIDAKDAAENALYLYNEEGMGFGYISGEEYLIYGTDSASLTFAKPETPDGIEIMTYSKKGLRTEFFCENSSESQKLVKLPILLYKGYTAFGNEGEQLEIMDDGSHILSVCVPAGFRGQIVVTFIEPWYWRAAELITLFTVVLFVIWMTRGFRFSDGSDLSVQSGNFYDMTEERSDV